MLPIVYQDEDVVVIDKPSGLLVHRSAIDRLETRFVVQELRDQLGQKVFPVHRLDKPTSGLLLLALNADAARQLTEQFTQKTVKKTYHAIVRGWATDQTIDYPLKEVFDKTTDPVSVLEKDAQAAVTQLSCMQQVELPHAVGRYTSARYSLVALRPMSGRRHQLRRHLKHIFHPIVGDTTYGDGKHNRYFRDQWKESRLMLSAVGMAFNHPMNGRELSFTLNTDKIIDVFQMLVTSTK